MVVPRLSVSVLAGPDPPIINGVLSAPAFQFWLPSSSLMPSFPGVPVNVSFGR